MGMDSGEKKKRKASFIYFEVNRNIKTLNLKARKELKRSTIPKHLLPDQTKTQINDSPKAAGLMSKAHKNTDFLS